MRIFLPATADDFGGAVGGAPGGELGTAPVAAFALTGALRESWADGDEEELSLVATEAAAWRSLVALAGVAPTPSAPRRVVLVADVPDAWVRPVAPGDPGAGDGAVLVDRPVPRALVVSVLADGAGAVDDLRAALPAVAAGRTAEDLDDVAALAADPALAALDELLATPLLWFDPAELPQLFDERASSAVPPHPPAEEPGP